MRTPFPMKYSVSIIKLVQELPGFQLHSLNHSILFFRSALEL